MGYETTKLSELVRQVIGFEADYKHDLTDDEWNEQFEPKLLITIDPERLDIAVDLKEKDGDQQYTIELDTFPPEELVELLDLDDYHIDGSRGDTLMHKVCAHVSLATCDWLDKNKAS